MNLLIKNVIVADLASPYCHQEVDILVENNCIVAIGKGVNKENVEVYDAQQSFIAQGFVDIFSDFSDPGFEHQETLETGAATALAGGFTKVFSLPNTQPVVQNKSAVEYIKNKAKYLPIDVLPLGAISQNADGKDLAEMYDMYAAGAVAFSDGKNTIQSSALMLKALQYVKAFEGTLITQPVEKIFSSNGLVNEGLVSTRLGLPGIPAIAEHIMIMRDIELLKYTNSRLHITGISTARSLELIQQAKADGLHITCSVTPYHPYFSDEDIQSYNTNLKVNAPLRTKADREALRKAVLDGTIDAIAVHHFPLHNDDKDCEFEYAKYGMIGLQTAFAAVNTALGNEDAVTLATIFSRNTRHIFGLEPATIIQNAVADFVIFDTQSPFTFSKEKNKSKSYNSPFYNLELKGNIKAVATKGVFTNLSK